MKTPPPRTAPLSFPLPRDYRADTHDGAPDDIYVNTHALPSVSPPFTPVITSACTPPDPTNTPAEPARSAYMQRISALSKLALASGTGEDVAALSDDTGPRPRLRLQGKSLQALALLIALILAGVWIYLGFDSRHLSESATKDGSASSSFTDADKEAATKEKTNENTPDKSGSIVVYISGAITNPGVYTLATSARVNDLVKMAGGLSDNAEQSAINLASPISDGEHVHIPAQGEVAVAIDNAQGGVQGEESGKININTASAAQLEELPGIGPALSQTIITWREDNGRFTSPEDLLEVSGIGQAKYAKLKDLVSVG